MNNLLLILLLVLSLGFSDGSEHLVQTSSQDQLVSDSLKVLEPKPEHSSETFVIINLLNRYHYRKATLNDSLSSVVFDNYFESLDPNKSYFLKGDLDYFEKYRYRIDNDLPEGNLVERRGEGVAAGVGAVEAVGSLVRPVLGDEGVLDDHIVAAGALQTHGVPGVLDAEIRARHQDKLLQCLSV